MNNTHNVTVSRIAASSTTPTWWIVFVREFHELWMGGKAPVLLLIFSILLGIITYMLATNNELSLMSTQGMVYETLKAAISASLFICLIIGADSISGERERSTLEALLLTPTSRRQIVVGKFLASISLWPVILVLTIPYMAATAQGHEVFRQAVPWGAIVGTVLAPAFTAIGMLASFWSNTNKTSLCIGLGIYVLFLLPSQLPARVQTGPLATLLQQANPLAATTYVLSKILLNNRTFGECWPWLMAPTLFAILVYGLLFWYVSPGLRLEGGTASTTWSSWGRRLGLGMFVVACCVVALNPASALALQQGQAPAAASVALPQPLQISVDLDYRTVKVGDRVLYNTVVTNHGAEKSPNLWLALNIINLNPAQDIVDPEDWSPQRTQYIEPLAAGESTTLPWRINAILEGNYLGYIVVVPVPPDKDATSQPVASTGIHLTVTPFARLNPSGVLPYAIGAPIVLAFGIAFIYRRRHRDIDMGDSA